MKWAPGTGGSSRFTCVGCQVYAAVDGVVVLVGRWGLTGVLPGRLVVNVDVDVVYERNVRCGVLYSKLWMSHEIVDGGSWVRFFPSLRRGSYEMRSQHVSAWGKRLLSKAWKVSSEDPPPSQVARWQQEKGKVVDPPKTSLIHLFYRAQFKDCIENNITQTHGKLKRLERKT